MYSKEKKVEKDFELFISQLSETNATLDYFTDFEKVKKTQIKLQSNSINSINSIT